MKKMLDARGYKIGTTKIQTVSTTGDTGKINPLRLLVIPVIPVVNISVRMFVVLI